MKSGAPTGQSAASARLPDNTVTKDTDVDSNGSFRWQGIAPAARQARFQPLECGNKSPIGWTRGKDPAGPGRGKTSPEKRECRRQAGDSRPTPEAAATDTSDNPTLVPINVVVKLNNSIRSLHLLQSFYSKCWRVRESDANITLKTI
jgi:hypothetical protein